MSTTVFTTLSIILLFGSAHFYRKTKPSTISMAIFFVMALTSIVFFIAYGVADHFTGSGIDEATLYHLKYGLSGAGYLEYSGLIVTSIAALLVATAYLLRLLVRSKSAEGPHQKNSLIPFFLLFSSMLINPTSIDLYNLKKNAFSAPKNEAEIRQSFESQYMRPYIKPSDKKQKNIVFIYAESLELTYFDENIFPGLITGLREIESKSTYFTDIKQVYGTAWTVAGMTASQCGIPLFTSSHGNSMSGMDQFLSSAVCLGDLLKEEGYQLNFMGGASLNFAGKGKLYKTHGFDRVLGREELTKKLKDKSYTTSWGLYDDSLLEMVYSRFIELSEKGEKFGLFTLTLDTHHPDGHPSKSCKGKEYGDASNSILNAVSCSDYLISKLIKKIENSSFSKNTLVVLVSDHLAFKNTAYDLLKKADRKNLFMIIEPEKANSKKVETAGSTLDIGATLLPLLGYEGAIGLGRDLLSGDSTAEERFTIHENIRYWREPISAFWDFPTIRDSVEIDVDKERVRIDKRSFKIPALIEFNKNFESTLKFQFNSSPEHKSLIEHQELLDNNHYFFLIDRCRNVNHIARSLGEKGYCLLAGQGKKYTKALKLEKNAIYTISEIRQLLSIPDVFVAHRVAHAGGGIDGTTYTNSIDALNVNIGKGFKYFEIDFSLTEDGELVCLHDWTHSFKRSFGFETDRKVTLSEFNDLVKNNSDYQKCTGASLTDWMKNNPSAKIISDVKENNIETLKVILKTLPNAKKRVIPQIYQPENIKTVEGLGFKKLIWTLYHYKGSNKDVLRVVKDIRVPIAVTMPTSRAESSLPKALGEIDIPTFVHTINTVEEERRYLHDMGITNIYTDFLAP